MNRKQLYYGLKEYFSFNRSERIGILILMTMIVIVVSIRILLPALFPLKASVDNFRYENDIQAFGKRISRDTAINHAQIVTAKKYPAQKYSSGKYQQKPGITTMLNINTADSLTLMKLPGIGPVFAGRIIKYRRLLGGFASKSQLSEVYGLSDQTITRISPYLKIDTADVVKISLNSATFKEINAHPYISFEQTKAIMKYRKYQRLQTFEDLKISGVFTDQELMKLKVYLRFDAL